MERGQEQPLRGAGDRGGQPEVQGEQRRHQEGLPQVQGHGQHCQRPLRAPQHLHCPGKLLLSFLVFIFVKQRICFCLGVILRRDF